MKRQQFLIQGQVQGVGFRPHVYRIAQRLRLTGWVQNHSAGVLVEVQGIQAQHFIAALQINLPSLAVIDQIKTTDCALVPTESIFTIRMSEEKKASQAMIPPDSCLCDACLTELFDPSSPYYLYPFVNCTQCGPRFTITQQLPYDRPQTAMAPFPLCDCCQQSYSDPMNRRYHAQPIACPQCGPTMSASMVDIAADITAGKIVAIKGMGGYQLYCDAHNAAAIAQLRQRKQRDAKPFALMVLNVACARALVSLDDRAEKILIRPERPIVLAQQISQVLPQSLAPGLSELGIMFPSTPIHYLLWHALLGFPIGTHWLSEMHPQVLVVTSANVAGQPLIIDDEEAYQALEGIADKIVSFNRAIITRADDSVIRPISTQSVMVRRARGYCPAMIPLPYEIPCTLGLGGDLKNTFCITRGDQAFVSQHIGSLTNAATIAFFHESLNHWIRFLGVSIERVACDSHPDFYTTRCAEDYGVPVVPIQHHHAHAAAVMAERHLLEPVLGLILDGYGYGMNGDSWGGELLRLERHNCQRLSHLWPLLQPGGDRAAREPWRVGVGVLFDLNRVDQIISRWPDQAQSTSLVQALLHPLIADRRTSSAGRLFDAASAILGVKNCSSYEGQAAMQLESLVTLPLVLADGWVMNDQGLSFLPLLEHLLELTPISGANIFHGTLIAGLAEWVLYWSQQTSIKTIVLSGGCFINRILTEGLVDLLSNAGLHVHLPQQLPVNDGGLSLGQAWIAGCNEADV